MNIELRKIKKEEKIKANATIELGGGDNELKG
jgi:hypothetical protein